MQEFAPILVAASSPLAPRRSHTTRVPPECIGRCISFLSVADHVRGAALVSKHWTRMCGLRQYNSASEQRAARLAWKGKCVWAVYTGGDDYLRRIASIRWITDLKLDHSHTVNSLKLQAMVANNPNIRRLSLNACPLTTTAGIAHLSRLPSLTELCLDYAPLIDDASLQPIRAMTGLKNLSLSSCNSITSGGLLQLAGHPSLTRLTMRDCNSILDVSRATTTSSTPMEFVSTLPSLTRLDLSNNDLTVEALQGVSRNRQISVLKLSGCSVELDDCAMWTLAQMTSLVDLDLSYIVRIPASEQAWGHLGSSLASLQKLDLSCKYGNPITPTSFAHLRRMTSLTHLNLSKRCIGSTELQAVATIKSLRQLNLSMCDYVDANGLGWLRALAHLTDLFLFSCRRVDSSALRVVATFPALRRLDIMYCTRLGPGSMRSLVSAREKLSVDVSRGDLREEAMRLGITTHRVYWCV